MIESVLMFVFVSIAVFVIVSAIVIDINKGRLKLSSDEEANKEVEHIDEEAAPIKASEDKNRVIDLYVVKLVKNKEVFYLDKKNNLVKGIKNAYEYIDMDIAYNYGLLEGGNKCVWSYDLDKHDLKFEVVTRYDRKVKKEKNLKTLFTIQELKDKNIAINCKTIDDYKTLMLYLYGMGENILLHTLLGHFVRGDNNYICFMDQSDMWQANIGFGKKVSLTNLGLKGQKKITFNQFFCKTKKKSA